MARAAVTSDVFNAIAEAHRRDILDVLMAGERPVGELVDVLHLAQPQVSKHLRVLSDVGLVKCRAEGRRRLYRLDHERLRPLYDWMAKYEQSWNQRVIDWTTTSLTYSERKNEVMIASENYKKECGCDI
jgi:DNA-binding transcriptional ArsR family regulator